MNTQRSFSSARHFIEHSNSIARRLKEQEVERISNRGRRLNGIEQVPIQAGSHDGPRRLSLRSPETIRSCPLPAGWTEWDIAGDTEKCYRVVSPEQHARCERARRTSPVRSLGRLRLAWESADGNARPAIVARLREGHVHAETTIGTRLIHIDLVEIVRGGPGRAITEVRIFVDGELAGRGGSCGCSLGSGGSDAPAVAIVGNSRVLAVTMIHGRGMPLAELWAVKHTPFDPES
jgi:hypothetical protein